MTDTTPIPKLKRPDVFIALAVAVAVLALYTWTMTPSVSAGDNGELSTAMFYLGIAHAPCYPLHSFAGKLMTFLPINTPGWRTNFFSVFCGTLVIFLSVLAYIKLLITCGTRPLYARGAAVITGIVFAVSESLWSQAIMCEVYTMSAVFFPALLLIALHWQDAVIENNRDPNATPYFGEKFLLAYALIFGLGMAGHQTILVTALFGFAHIVLVLWKVIVLPRHLTGEQVVKGLVHLGVVALLLAVAFGTYYLFIVDLGHNLYDTSNVKTGMITFLACNAILVGIYIFYRHLAPDMVDNQNYLQRATFVITKMFLLFYLGYAIHAYMLIRAHGNPPINWMGINEVSDWWLKFGKFFNAIWRKQYGNMGILPMTTDGLPVWFSLLVTKIHGTQYSVFFYLVALLGLVGQWFKDKKWLFLTLVGLVGYNVVMTVFLKFHPDDRAIFFVKVFYMFSYFMLSIPIAYGLAFGMELLDKALSRITGKPVT